MKLSETLHHFAIAVGDLGQLIDWYSKTLDFEIEKRFVLTDANLEIVKLISPGGVRVELLKEIDGPPTGVQLRLTAPGSKHICFHVASVDKTAAELRERGVTFTQHPKTITESNERNCWIRDPEGNMIEFIEELD